LLQNHSKERPLLNHNLDRECKFKNIKEEKFGIVLKTIEEFLSHRETIGLTTNLDDVFNHLRYSGISEKSPYLMGNEINDKYNELYTYMSYDEFWKNCVGQKSHAKEIELDGSINQAKEDLRKELKKDKPKIDKELYRNKELKDLIANEFFWVFKPDFNQIDIQGKNKANFILNMIGLYYEEKEIDLVQIKVNRTKLFVPTIFDGWHNDYFVSAKRDDQWGQAINFDLHEGGYEGFPQSISKKTLVRNALEVKIVGTAKFKYPCFDIKKLIEYLKFDLERWDNNE